MKKIMILITALLVCDTLYAQDRTPVYVHGLGAEATNWQQWRNAFNTERRMTQGNNSDYNSGNGVINMSNQVSGQLNTVPFNNTIYFGHSMGGVVGRHIDVNNTGGSAARVGGYITAGSPFDGARIANNVINGSVQNFILNSVDKVLKGPLRTFSPTVAMAYEVLDNLVEELASDHIEDVIAGIIPGAQSTADLAEGSAYMNSGIRTATTVRPKIHIYGNENSPVLWRMASVEASGADHVLVDVAQYAASVYNTQKAINISLGLAGAIHHFWVADGWAEGESWFANGAENGWNDLIGTSIPAFYTNTVTHIDYNQYWECMNDPRLDGWTEYQKSVHCEQQEHVWITETFTHYSPVNGISDGFIKAPSQTGFNSNWSGNAVKIEALGVNHLEMRSHPTMKGVYDAIMDGSVPGVNQFFITARRL